MENVYQRLESTPLTIWRDTRIEAGEDWNDEIESALRNSGCVIFIATANAHNAKGVIREINFAQERDIPIIPLLAADDPKKAIPYTLKELQYVDIRADFEAPMRNLIATIYERLYGALALRILLEAAYSYLPRKSKSRIALFKVDLSDELFIHSVAGIFTEEELQLRYEKGVGVVGTVWQDYEEKGVEIGRVAELSLDTGDSYHLPQHYLKITGYPRTVLAIPIFHRVQDKMIGILAVDSPFKLNESGLTTQNRIERLTSLTFFIAKFLE